MNLVQGYYSIIRWCPDLLRDECRNLGIILADDTGEFSGVRHLSASALPETIGKQGLVLDLLHGLQARCEHGPVITSQELEQMSRKMSTYLRITPPEPTVVPDGDWEEALAGLWADYARPRAGAIPPKLVQPFEQRFRALLARKVIAKDYVFQKAHSGMPRRVDFFANSGANIALDTLRLSFKRNDDIIQRADAEAYKAQDVLRGNPEVQFVVYCDLPGQPAQLEVAEAAMSVIRTSGAKVTTHVDEAAQWMEAAIRQS